MKKAELLDFWRKIPPTATLFAPDRRRREEIKLKDLPLASWANQSRITLIGIDTP